MRKYFTYAILSLAMMPAAAQQVCLETDFTQGIPADFKLVCNDQMPVKTTGFNLKYITPAQTWFANKVNSTDGRAAMSTSYRNYDMNTDNWMITPKLTLPRGGNVVVQWTAKAIHYYKRDGYSVWLSTTGNNPGDFTVKLFGTEAENYDWTRHTVLLDSYAGQEIYLAFRHDSRSRFLIAVDDLYVGEPREVEFSIENETRRFAGQGEQVDVTGQVNVLGKAFFLDRIDCIVNGTDTLSQPYLLEAACLPNDPIGYNFASLPNEVGKVTRYDIDAVAIDGTRYKLLSDSVVCSYYRRTLLLEKSTGTWCTSCPTVNPFVNRMRERYGSELLCIEAHCNDYLSYGNYFSGIGTANLPAIDLNRTSKYRSYHGEEKLVRQAVLDETLAEVKVETDFDGDTLVKVKATVKFARNLDNSGLNYRLGFALLEKKVASGGNIIQSSGVITQPVYEEFYFLPSPIPADLMVFSNVARTNNAAFDGIKGSLPATILAGEEYVVDTTLVVPTWVADKENLSLSAFAVNFYTDKLLNVGVADVVKGPSAISLPAADETVQEVRLSLQAGGRCYVACPEDAPFTLELMTPAGHIINKVEAPGNGTYRLAPADEHGIRLLRITQQGRVWTKKLVF